MSRLTGKVALITGAARGQGRSHAVTMAAEGADIIAIDRCGPIDSVPYELPTPDDLAETAAEVEKLDRRVITAQVDVRDMNALSAAVDSAVSELGRLDVVSVNAGICTLAPALEMSQAVWSEMLDINLTGAWLTARASVPHIQAGGRGGSVVFTSSDAGFRGQANLAHYVASKHGVLGLMKSLAIEVAPDKIRVNAVCPGNVDTPMIVNPTVLKLFLPHVESPTRADAEAPGSGYVNANLFPVPWVDPVDVSKAVLYLASDDARFITGVALPVDAGYLLKS
jgi:SDR family mycofactocin-dependent oxidoreductase